MTALLSWRPKTAARGVAGTSSSARTMRPCGSARQSMNIGQGAVLISAKRF